MRIALVDSNPKPKVYPLALLKIGAWRKSQGDTCKIYDNKLPKHGEYDEIWITTTFTYDIPYVIKMVREAKKRAGRVWVGGVSASLFPKKFEKYGVDVHKGLLMEAEKYHPDYTLLSEDPKYSISHTSRGCVRNCGFCMVPRLEPVYVHREGWEKDINCKTEKVLFFDNNWLAKKPDDIKEDIKIMRRLVASGKIKSMDFNQGLDARLLTEEMADMLKGLPIKPIRFAFDGMQQDGYYQRAVRMMAERGFRVFMAYVLYNYKDTPQDFYYRLRESVVLTSELGLNVGSFPMRYQPIMIDVDKEREYVGKKWTERKKKGFMNILNKQSIGGAITFIGSSMTEMGEFEYWFGKDAEEFNRLLSYPKLNQLMKRKKGALRMNRSNKFIK